MADTLPYKAPNRLASAAHRLLKAPDLPEAGAIEAACLVRSNSGLPVWNELRSSSRSSRSDTVQKETNDPRKCPVKRVRTVHFSKLVEARAHTKEVPR